MEVVFKIAETITAENEPTSLVFAGLKNERVKETNPRKGTETHFNRSFIHSYLFHSKRN